MANVHNPGYGDHAQLEGPAGKQNIGYWTDARAWAAWSFQFDKPGTYQVIAEIATPSDSSRVRIQIGKEKLGAKVPHTGELVQRA